MMNCVFKTKRNKTNEALTANSLVADVSDFPPGLSTVRVTVIRVAVSFATVLYARLINRSDFTVNLFNSISQMHILAVIAMPQDIISVFSIYVDKFNKPHLKCVSVSLPN